MAINIPGTTLEPPRGTIVSRGDIEERPYAIFSDGKVMYRGANEAVVIFVNEAAFRDWVSVPDKRAEGNQKVVMGLLMLAFGVAAIAREGIMMQGGGGFVTVSGIGSITAGAGLFVRGLTVRGEK